MTTCHDSAVTALVFDTGGARLAGERHDGGEAVVVALHAGVCDRRSWRAAIAHLAGAVTVVSYDRRGYGDTPPSSASFSHLQDLVTVLDELGEKSVWLLGNSMGGRLALDFALLDPGRVAGLILIAPAISGAPEEPLDEATQRLVAAIEHAYDAHRMDEVNQLEARLWLDGPTSAEGRVGGAPRALALEMNAVALAHEAEQEGFESASEINAWERLGQIMVPAVIACGELDVPACLNRARVIAAGLPNGELAVLPGIAHLPSLEAPALVADLILRTVAP